MKNLKYKVVVIGGGNNGTGYSTTKELKKLGAQLTITGRKKEAVKQAALVPGAKGPVTDQSNVNDIENMISQIANEYGIVDILLLNAGVSQFSSIGSTTENLFDRIMNASFKEPLLRSATSSLF